MPRLFPVDQSATIDDTLQADLDQAIEARDRLLIGWRTNRHLDHWKAAGQLAVLDRWIRFLSGRVEPLTEREPNDREAGELLTAPSPGPDEGVTSPARLDDGHPRPLLTVEPGSRSVSGPAPLLLGIAPNPFEETSGR